MALPEPLDLGRRTGLDEASQGHVSRHRGCVILHFRFRLFGGPVVSRGAQDDGRAGEVFQLELVPWLVRDPLGLFAHCSKNNRDGNRNGLNQTILKS